MKKLLFILILFTACAKEPMEERKVQLSVEGAGNYIVTYGTASSLAVIGEGKWSAVISAYPGETIRFQVKTTNFPATLYMGVQVQAGLLFCQSLYIEPNSLGSLNYVVSP